MNSFPITIKYKISIPTRNIPINIIPCNEIVGMKRPHLDAATNTKRSIAKKAGEIKINKAE